MAYEDRRMSLVSRRQALRAVGVGMSSLLLGACATAPGGNAGAADFSARFAAFEAADEPNGDLTKVVWPAFITRSGKDIQQLYAFQVEHGHIMKYMPCFCGCHLEDGHRNNRDCYIDTVNPDGSVVFDSMAPT